MSLIEKSRSVHFVGIGGIGMSGIAELLLKLGHRVSGSDQSESDSVQRLKKMGAKIQIGHRVELFAQQVPEVIVYSTAVAATNPELVYGRAHQIPIIRRAEMLGELMRLKRGIALAGSHGKTTTTGIVSLLLQAAGLDPTVIIGGRFDAIGSNAALGEGRWLVAEADESDGSFLRLTPELAVVTNIDREHLDHYQNFENVIAAFEDFIDRVPFYGRAILNSDCPRLRELAPRIKKPQSWYGVEQRWQPDFLVRVVSDGAEPEFEILPKREDYRLAWLRVRMSVPGVHNMLNATAAALVARELEIAPAVIEKALREFRGVSRRFELKGHWGGHPVIEDYAHHPTEIRATLSAAKSAFGALKPVVVFQPHRFSRTRDQWHEFAGCFAHAAAVLTLPIYAASESAEAWTRDYDGDAFAKNISGGVALACVDFGAALAQLDELARGGRLPAGAPILILGAGDIYKLVPKLLARAPR